MQKIIKGDEVKIVLGKDNGKVAKVTKVLPEEGKVFVEGINIYKRHISGKRQGINEGGIVDIQKPVNISNVMIVCPNCKKITRAGFKITAKEKVRICRKCGKELKYESPKK
jgi:large subunit ribosomal protein L24